MVTSHSILYGVNPSAQREEFAVAGTGEFGGAVVSPLPVFGGPIDYALPPSVESLPVAGSGPLGYWYTILIPVVNATIFVGNVGATAVDPSFGPLSGPLLVNFTGPSGCVLASGPVNSSTYTTPTSNACANTSLGGGARILAGDSIVVWSSVDLSGANNWIALYAFGDFTGVYYYGIG